MIKERAKKLYDGFLRNPPGKCVGLIEQALRECYEDAAKIADSLGKTKIGKREVAALCPDDYYECTGFKEVAEKIRARAKEGT